MPEVLYDAHPSLLRSRPFATLLTILLMLGVILVGIGVFALAPLQILTWWVATLTDHLEITADEILWTHGLLSKQYTEIHMASVRTVRASQTLFQRLMNAGDITIYTAGDTPELVVRGLPDPARIRELIKSQPNAGS